jgi:glutamine synthetase type III
MTVSETSTRALFGSNVFSVAEMKARLPKEVFKSLKKTIDLGEKLDSTVDDVVAAAMRDWAIEKSATNYAHAPCIRRSFSTQSTLLTFLTTLKYDSNINPTSPCSIKNRKCHCPHSIIMTRDIHPCHH